MKERAKQKKDDIESVKKRRKWRQRSGFADNKDGKMDFSFEVGKSFDMPNDKRPGVALGDRFGYRQLNKVDKAGAIVLFEDSDSGSNNFGIVVSTVRISCLLLTSSLGLKNARSAVL